MTPEAPSGRNAWLRSVVVGLVLTAAGASGVFRSLEALLGQAVRYSGSVSTRPAPTYSRSVRIRSGCRTVSASEARS